MRHVDLSIAVVDGLGLDVEMMFSVISVIDDYAIGFTLGGVNQEMARRRIGASFDELRERWQSQVEPIARELISTGNYPHLARVDQDFFDFFDIDRHFSLGLETVLGGIAARIAALGERGESSVDSR